MISQYGNVYRGLSTDTKPSNVALNGREFEELDTSKVYKYDKDNNLWRPWNVLSNADVTDAEDGQILQYDAEEGKWVPATINGGTVDDTLTLSGQAADAKAAGDALRKAEYFLEAFNTLDAFYGKLKRGSTTTSGGLTYNWNGTNYIVSAGSTTDYSARALIEKEAMPDYLIPGEQYDVVYQTSDPNVTLRIIFKDSNDDTISTLYFPTGRTITIPDAAAKWAVSLFVTINKVLSSDVTVNGDIRFMTARTNRELSADILAAANNAVSNAGRLTSAADIDDITTPGMWHVLDGNLPQHWPSTKDGRFLCFGANSDTRYTKCQVVIDIDNNMWYRLGLSSQYNAWTKIAQSADLEFCRTNLLESIGEFTDTTQNGIKFSWLNHTTCKLTGTATGSNNSPSVCNIVYSKTELPPGINVGDTLYFHLSGNSDGVGYRIYLYPNTLPNREFTAYGDTRLRIPSGCIGIIIRLDVVSGTALSESGDTIKFYCLKEPDAAQIGERIENDGIKLLVFGSSSSYSTLSYVPALIKECYPEMPFVLGICYDSGQYIAGHISNWNNDTPYTTYCEYVSEDGRGGVWAKMSASVTGKNAMDRHKWDYVVMQQGVRHLNDADGYSSMETFADLIVDYVTHPIAFLFNMMQPLGANCTFPASYTQDTGEAKSAAMFETLADFASRALDDCIMSDVLPGGTAVQNARTSSLKQYGATGEEYLCADDIGHLENGIGVLCAGYAVTYKILDLAGKKCKPFGFQLAPTDAWITAYNSPSSMHGSCVGVTDANRLLAQKCALAAIKHPFDVTDFSSY